MQFKAYNAPHVAKSLALAGVVIPWCLHSKVEHLKALVLTGRSANTPGSPSTGHLIGRRSEVDVAVAEAVERERLLATALIRCAEQERDELRLRQDEYAQAVSRYESDNGRLNERIAELQDALRSAELKASMPGVEQEPLDGVTTRKKTSVVKELVNDVTLHCC